VKRLIAAAAMAAALAACGGGGGEDKSIFSLWTRDGDGAKFDLSGARFGADNYVYLFTQEGTRCICNLAVIGDESAGAIAFTGCISSPYNASRNRSCEALDGSGNYTKANSILTLTREGRSGTFR
jgi:hypothetical protein